MRTHRAALLILFVFVSPLRAQTVDDSDLTGRRVGTQTVNRIVSEGRREGKALVFPLTPAGGVSPAARAGFVTGSLLLTGRDGKTRPGRLVTVTLVGSDGAAAGSAETGPDGSWSIPAPSKAGTYTARFALGNRYWGFQNPSGDAPYAWESPAFALPSKDPVVVVPLEPEPGTENAKVGMIHLTYLEMLDYLAGQGVGLGWWKKTLPVNWPADADYFSPWGFTLQLTNPLAWDVNLHEMGHSVMHQAMRARSAGGPHKIDECYSPELAWSEGWATFFAAAVHLDAADPDAKFEYLVPRRAPIRIENCCKFLEMSQVSVL